MTTAIQSFWVLKGNIVPTRTKAGETLGGTRLFRPGAKVYLATLTHNWAILEPRKIESIQVLGQHRKSRKWIISYLCSTYVENWRITQEHNPLIVNRLLNEEWYGSELKFSCDENKRSSHESIKAFIDKLLEVESSQWMKNQDGA